MNTFDNGNNLHIRSAREARAGLFWTASHLPATNVIATATKASAGNTARLVCTGFVVKFSALATAPTAVTTSVSLIDGATGTTTLLCPMAISCPATGGADGGVSVSNTWIVGSPGKAMTLEFAAAGGTNTIESVAMWGTVVTE